MPSHKTFPASVENRHDHQQSTKPRQTISLFFKITELTFQTLKATMKISRARFVIIFLLLAFVFQFISNSLLGPEIGLFPADAEWFPGTHSPIRWKSTLATILFPIKYALIAPLSFLTREPDPPPPLLVVAFAIYWTGMAFILYYLFDKVINRRKRKA